MPYSISENGLVVLGDDGKPVPGGEHKTHAEALAHLRALEANVEDAHKSIDLGLVAQLNQQFNRERQNEAVYLAAAGALEKLNLVGFARFMMQNANDEAQHARKFFDWIADLGEQPLVDVLEQVDAPVSSNLYQAGLVMFKFALQAEQANMDALKSVYQAAGFEPATQAFLFPILLEQQQSIRDFEQYVTELTLAQDDAAAYLALNDRFGEVTK